MILVILKILGVLSMVIGVLLALYQWDYKRLLAYHSISQVGYIILSIGLGTPLGILGGLFHLLNHSVFKSLLFLTSGAVEYTTGTRDLRKMGGLKEKMPVTATASFVASMSIAGIPPFNGFWSKLVIILACIQVGKFGLGLIAIIVSLLTLASFLKVQKYAFFGKLNPEFEQIKEVSFSMKIAMILLSMMCIFMGLLLVPGIKSVFLNPAVEVLTNGVEYGRVVFENIR
ncbi:MAG: proton-conducting transporter membrane subunit [Elusimicrobiota bacterium]|nr:proton-conducting transporter membrane subunit [Elusimicrobiota bacterium]